MTSQIGEVNRYSSISTWKEAWYAYGKVLGRANSPAPPGRRDFVEVDAPHPEVSWLHCGVEAFFYLVKGGSVDTRLMYRSWQATAGEVFTQVPLDYPHHFHPFPRKKMRSLLEAATDTEQGALSYAKFLAALAHRKSESRKACFIITDATIQPHNWDHYPERRGESLGGITTFRTGVALATQDMGQPTAVHAQVHEMFHLLGFAGHHENFEVLGFPEEEECVMQRANSTTRLCQRDRAALISFWKGVAAALNKRFLRAT